MNEPVGRSAQPSISAWPTGREVVHSALSDSVQHLLAHLPVARAGVDPEGVHQCRVAARRLRSDLRTFRPLLDENWARPLQRDLGEFADAFGAVRDDDVMLEALRSLDAAPELLGAIEVERRAHHDALLATLDDPATQRLLDALVAAADDPMTAPQADDPADELLRPLVRKRWRQLQRGVEALTRHSSDDDVHQVRLLAKRCRYSMTAVAPAFGPPALALAKALGKLQDALGERNDMRIMAARLQDTATHFDAPLAFAAGEAVGRLQARAMTNQDAWRRAWKRASAKELRAWL